MGMFFTVLGMSLYRGTWGLTGLVSVAIALAIILHQRPLQPKDETYKKNWVHLGSAGALFATLHVIATLYAPVTLGRVALGTALLVYLGAIFLGK